MFEARASIKREVEKMGLIRALASTAVTLGVAGAGLQVSGVYDVSSKLVKPVVAVAQSESYAGLKELQLVNFSDTKHVWENLTNDQRRDFAKRGVSFLSLDERTELIRKEWEMIGSQGKYSIIRSELDLILEQHYK